jgi:catechol 2,3-dioxygenase-like lactoylglutathione lyase family enzyme
MIRGGAVVLNVADVGQAVRFYVETLGMKLVAEEAGGASIIDAGEGFQIELQSGPTSSARPTVKLYAKVPLEEAVAIYENRGVRFVTSGQTATFSDPDGNTFVLTAAAGEP